MAHSSVSQAERYSSSRVLTARPRSYGKGQISTPYKIKTPERIAIKFGTVDYVLEICPPKKIRWWSDQRGFWVNMWNIQCLLLYFFPEPTPPGDHTPKTNFHAECLEGRGSTYRCAFCSKNRKLFLPLTPRPRKPPKFGTFGAGFSLDITF